MYSLLLKELICHFILTAGAYNNDQASLPDAGHRHMKAIETLGASKNGPRQANLILIAYASSDGSGTSSESRGTFKKKARSLAPLNGWACAVEVYHDGRHKFA